MSYLIAVLILLSFAWVLFRVLARRDYLQKGKLSPLTSLLELVLFAFHANLMYLFIPVRWPRLPRLSENATLYVVSLVLIVAGLAIVFGALIPLGYLRTMGLKSRRLKTSGLYSVTRNPQVIGYYLFLMGFVVSYASLYALGWIVLYGCIVHLMILTEEEYLRKVYGKSYLAYCNRVPRYIG